jgi:hypothetical protein
MKDMSLKDEAGITKLLKDKRKIWSELKAYCSQQVLQTAKSLIQHELTEQGKEALADVSPDNEVSILLSLVWSFGYIVWFQQEKRRQNLYILLRTVRPLFL